jgi:hypothetical protein
MTIKQQGESLWGEDSLKYKCGCTQIAGKPTCAIHDKPIREQMIYGNDSNISSLNEKEDYKNNNLNEGR